MFLKIFSALLVIVAGILIFASFQPAAFRIARSATIAAPAAVLFDQVNDYHKWEAWSPWAKLDPNAKNTFEGPGSGVGAKFGWSGNNEVGEGLMEITEARPNEAVAMRLDFLRPFKATNRTEFTFKAEGAQTTVTWSMSGNNNLMAKTVGLFMDCDKMVGGQFDKGLASLKAIVEAPAKPLVP